MKNTDIQKQKSEWKRKGWSIPELRGGKQEWFNIVTELIKKTTITSIADMGLSPELESSNTSYPWRTYAPFLKGIGLISNHSGILSLSDIGIDFSKNPSKWQLACLLNDKYRLVGEILEMLISAPKTVEDVDRELCQEYSLNWVNLSNTRRRMDWLEVLGLIEGVGSRKWAVTEEGKRALKEWNIVTPDVVDMEISDPSEINITPPPAEILELLSKLNLDPSLHNKRNTYNVWVPSPNRIENLRTIIQFAFERVTRSELFNFIEEEFNLKASSVESMMPFLRADGLIEEVGRNIYMATVAAKAWCESGNDLDFIRIIHAHKRFVGEMIIYANQVVARNDVYVQAKKFGINKEKARWIMGFLLEAGLLEETQYLHIKATPLGSKFVLELPLMEVILEPPTIHENSNKENTEKNFSPDATDDNKIFEGLKIAARDPMARGKASGVAFEESIAEVFNHMGFEAKRIGGAGNTDVVVRWKDSDGETITAVVDGKSKSSGTVSHGDVSDVAIETHKEKNGAEFVAIIGPGFGGDTLKNHARKKGFALITDIELIDIAKSSQMLGLSLAEISLLFRVPNGFTQLTELITNKQREQDIVFWVVSTFKQEQNAMESLSARDLYFLLRRTEISPSLEELIAAFEMLSKDEIGILIQIKKASEIENTTYVLRGEHHCVNRLRALANSIEKGLS